jgi:hypothetical protein
MKWLVPGRIIVVPLRYASCFRKRTSRDYNRSRDFTFSSDSAVLAALVLSPLSLLKDE